MNILDTHNHRLVFNLHEHASTNYREIWNKLKIECESGDNQHIVEQIKKYSKSETIKNMPYLKRVEGGLGVDDNKIHKQIRFRHIFNEQQQLNGGNIPYCKKDDSIIFNEIISTEVKKWTYNELDDLIYAFIKTANNYIGKAANSFIGTEYVSGYIELINNTTFSDDYLDSDSESE